VTLQRLAGLPRAAELLMLAEPVDAERALSLGLFTSVVDDDELPARPRPSPPGWRPGRPALTRAIKESLEYSAGHGCTSRWPARPTFQERLGQNCATTRTRARAFLRKETPEFEGR